MYERIKKNSSYRIVAFFAGFLFLSTALSVTFQSPTHALSINLGQTVQAVTNNVPVVKSVVPLLIPSPTTNVTTPQQTRPTAPSAPQTPVQQTTPAQATPAQTVPAATENTQVEATGTTTAAPSNRAAGTVASANAPQSLTQNGLSVDAKETQIASAIPHANSPAITYGTNALNGKTAGAIILGSLAAIAGGTYILYAYRPSVFARR